MQGQPGADLVDLVLREVHPAGPDQTWVGDITYIKTWTGWAFLATVIDCHSRKVIGWSIADHMRTKLIVDALDMALKNRNPQPASSSTPTAAADDRLKSAQYSSHEFRAFCRSNNVGRSVKKTGICYDKPVAESSFGTIKKELGHLRRGPLWSACGLRCSPTLRPTTTASDFIPRSAISARKNTSLHLVWSPKSRMIICPRNREQSTGTPLRDHGQIQVRQCRSRIVPRSTAIQGSWNAAVLCSNPLPRCRGQVLQC